MSIERSLTSWPRPSMRADFRLLPRYFGRELRSFEPSAIGKEGNVKELKGRYARRIPMELEIAPVFRAVLARHPKGRLFNFEGRKAADKLRLHLKLAGVTREELFRGTKTRKNMTSHDLRATGITWAAMRGDDLAKIMQRAAHQSYETTKVYLREAENLRDADFGVPFPPLPRELWEEQPASPGAAQAPQTPSAPSASHTSICDGLHAPIRRTRAHHKIEQR